MLSIKLICGNCIEEMKKLEDNSINCCITSPPYWGLRDYGVEGQFGLEKTPEEYVNKMVIVFNEVKRVLKKEATLWLNLGDSYATTKVGNTETRKNPTRVTSSFKKERPENLKQKDLVGIPWRVAFALQADGWYLRQDIIWHKPNPMPESVTDRCTKAHEYIFLLAKSQKYYFDGEKIKEKSSPNTVCPKNPSRGKKTLANKEEFGVSGDGWADGKVPYRPEKRNKRSVWTVTTKPFKGAHFATFPEDLILPCVLAGCLKGGIILDPFAGAGTTGVVAKKNNRNFIGIELNPVYAKMAQKRIDNTMESLF